MAFIYSHLGKMTKKNSQTNNWNKLVIKKSFMDRIIEWFLDSSDKTKFWWKDKIFFYKELVYMMKGWVSLMETMQTIQKTSENAAVKKVAQEISWYLNQGRELSYAISRLPEYFNEGDAAIIKTWEISGNLAEVLQSLANEYAYLNDIKQKYIGALTYPAILIVISIAAVIYLFWHVLPWIFDALSWSVQEMPAITTALKTFSDVIVAHRNKILVFLVLAILLALTYSATEKGKKKMYKIMLHLPIIWNMTKSYYLIKWARYTKLMIESGMDYVDTFRLLRDVLRIPLYQSMIEQVLADISLGKSLYDPISEHSDIIPSNVAVLIKVWEETANLENAMQNVVDIYQEELDNSIRNFSKAIEPLILILVWGIVLMIALWVFSLIFAVMDSAWI